jgi:hypothetical protein
MSEAYHDQTVLRPVVIATQAPGPLANPLAAIPPKVWRNAAITGATAFTLFGAVGGFWLANQLSAAAVAAANSRADKAEQRQQAVETQLASVQSQLKEFCSAVLSSPPATPTTPPTAGAVATNPTKPQP